MGRSAFTAVTTFVMAAVAGSVLAVTVATPENGILWQAVRDPSQPIEWRWEGDDVTSARVTIASPMDGTTFAPVSVARTGGSLYGSIAMPGGRIAGKEYLYDITVELLAGETVKDTLNARVVFLPERAAVDSAGNLSKRRVEGAALYSYNAQCDEDAVAPASVTVQGSEGRIEVGQVGSSGYGCFSEGALRDLGGSRLLATLAFGGGAVAWSNYLRLHVGFAIVVQ